MRRAILGVSGGVILLAVGVLLLGFAPGEDPAHSAARSGPALLGYAFVAAVIMMAELRLRGLLWLAAAPAALGFTSLFSAALDRAPAVESWLAGLLSADTCDPAHTMPVVASAGLALTGGILLTLLAKRGETLRLVAIALVGSLLCAVGLTTIAGYAVNMPLACRWGAAEPLPQIVAIAMILTGSALLLFAWDRQTVRTPATPAWLPMPVVVACATFTLVFWAGLREREAAYLGANSQIAINTFAGNINLELERQSAVLERMARRWSAGGSAAVWESDAITWLPETPGAHALSFVKPDGSTAWYYPLAGNENLIGFNHLSDPFRRAAIEAVKKDGSPEVTSTIEIPGRGPGFAIYAPVYGTGSLMAYVGAEFGYEKFLATLDQRMKLAPSHRCAVFLGGRRIYVSPRAGEPSLDGPRVLESVFTIKNRRMRIVMEPADEYLRGNRRYLPEIFLAAGAGITLLLGLSIHFARAALANLSVVESTNSLLRAENEERRRIEEMLKVTDERLRLALDATVIGIFEWDCSSGSIQYSSGLWDMLGLAKNGESSTPEAWQALIHPDDLPAYLAAVQGQLGGRQTFIEPEYRVRTVTGEWRWLYMRSKIVGYSDSGYPVRIVGTLQDVTARRESEQALLASQAAARKLSLVASRTDNLVLILTPDGAIDWVNESFERVMEYTLREAAGRNPAAFMIGPETNPRTLQRIKSAFAQGEGISTDIVHYSKSGRKYHLHLEIQPVRNDRGVLENFIAIEADITARVETENALRRAKSEADTASRAKSDFLASMSHEIRTPMNGVIGMTSLLLETPLTPEQRDSVNTIRSSGEALLSIINDLLDFSKIESGKLDLEHLPFEIAACVEETLDLFAGQAAARRIELAYHVEPGVPAVALGDVNRLRQVLANLVNNAIKFTPSGGVSIVVSLAKPDSLSTPLLSGHSRLCVSVRDTGIGIPAERLDRLFKPFSQVDSSITRKYGGTGLGLVICQRLCRLMGGDICVESEHGRGSTFIFTAQIEAASVAPTPPRLPQALRAGPVLCVDDNPVNLRRLADFLRSAGMRVMPAADADAALAHLANEKPSAVILDLDLPESSGATPLRDTLVALGVPVVGQLASGAAASPAWTERARLVAVARPLRTLALVRALHTLFPSPDGGAAPVAPRDPFDLSGRIPLNILLVEDNPVNQKVALRFLERLGYRANSVANGLEALNAIEAHHYQLVFMDLQMPEMDGFEAARRIRRDLPAHRQPCIVALTANALQSDRDQASAAGMNDFITKPVKLGEISEVILRHFGAAPRAFGT